MIDFIIPMIFGWPMIILSLGFAFAGILFKKPTLSIVGGVLFLPPAWYLSLYFSLSIILPAFIFGSSYAISKNKMGLALLLIAPVLIATGWLGFLVLIQ